MSAILIQPKDSSDFRFLTELLLKMQIDSKILSDEEWEDFGLGLLMKEADRADRVHRESIMEKLRAA